MPQVNATVLAAVGAVAAFGAVGLMLQKQGDEREERQAAAEHDQNEQVRLKALESINSQQKEQYQSRDYRIGKVCNMRVDYVFNAVTQLAKEVDRLVSMKRDLVLHVPLLGNDENKTLILSTALLAFGDEEILANVVLREPEFFHWSFGVTLSGLTVDSVALLNDKFLRPLSEIRVDNFALGDKMVGFLSSLMMFTDLKAQLIVVDTAKGGDPIVVKYCAAAKHFGLFSSHVVQFDCYMSPKDIVFFLPRDPKSRGYTPKKRNKWLKDNKNPLEINGIRDTGHIFLANFDTDRGFIMDCERSVIRNSPGVPDSIGVKLLGVGRPLPEFTTADHLRQTDCVWTPEALENFIQKRCDALAVLTVARQASAAMKRGVCCPGNSLRHSQVVAGNSQFLSGTFWNSMFSEFLENDLSCLGENRDSLFNVLVVGLSESLPRPVGVEMSDEKFQLLEVSPFVEDLINVLRWRSNVAQFNAAGQTPLHVVGDTNYADFSAIFEGILRFSSYGQMHREQLSYAVSKDQKKRDAKMLAMGDIPKINERYLIRLWLTCLLLVALCTHAVSFFQVLGRVVIPGWLLASEYVTRANALFSAVFGLYAAYVTHSVWIWKVTYPETLRVWNTRVSKVMAGYGFKRFMLPVMVAAECEALEAGLNERMRVWAMRIMLANLKRACRQKCITTSEVLLTLSDIETVLFEKETNLTGDEHGSRSVKGVIRDPGLCGMLDQFLELPVVSKSKARRAKKKHGMDENSAGAGAGAGAGALPSMQCISATLQEAATAHMTQITLEKVIEKKLRDVRLAITDAAQEDIREAMRVVREEKQRDKESRRLAIMATEEQDDDEDDENDEDEEEEEKEEEKEEGDNVKEEENFEAAAGGGPGGKFVQARDKNKNQKVREKGSKRVIQFLKDNNWILVRQSGHYHYHRTVKGVNQAFTRAKTPSDHRSQHNELSRLRRLNAAVDEQIMQSSLQKMLGAMLSEGRLERGRGQGSDAAGGGN